MSKTLSISPRATTAILVSTNDIFAANDANILIDAMTYRGFDNKGVLIGPSSFVNSEDAYLTPLHKTCLERFIVPEPGRKVAINDIEIHTLKTMNHDKTALGYKILTNDFTVCYPGFTRYSRELVEQYRNSNILILNVKQYGDKRTENSLNLEEAKKIILEVKPRLAIITGFGASILENDPLYLARELQKATSVQTLAAKDGLVINPVSYSAEKGQKTLTGIH
jgi:phosphoribosyl 1,2-cyclic phosphodiesterase